MRILGIDLGSTSIKAVELDSAFGRYEIHDYHEIKLEPGMSPELALARLMESLPKSPDRIGVTMPTRQITFRNLKLPTRDKKAIQSTVGFELEDELPFPLDKAIFDYSILSQTKQGTVVHVAATLKRHIVAAIEAWNTSGIDPDQITTECWAYRTLLNRVVNRADQEEPILLADIGHARTVLYLHWRGAPVMSREIPWGGRDLSAAIAQKYNLPPEQAEAATIDHGFVIQDTQREHVTAEQADFSDTLMNPIRELLSELRQAQLICKNLTHRNLSALYVSGGPTLMPGFVPSLEEKIHLRVGSLQGLSSIATSGVTYSEHTDAVFLLAAATALCLAGTERGAILNLRKGELAKKSRSREINLSSLRRPLLAVSAIAATLFVSVLVESVIYKSRLQELDGQLEKGVKTFFETQSSNSVRTYLSSTAKLRSSVNDKLGKQRELSRLFSPNARSPVEFLRTLSSSIPKDVVVDLTQFQVGAAPTASFNLNGNGGGNGLADQTASLTFVTPNPQSADRLANLLGSKLSGAPKPKTEEIPGTDPNTKRWKITFTGKPAEEAYGK